MVSVQISVSGRYVIDYTLALGIKFLPGCMVAVTSTEFIKTFPLTVVPQIIRDNIKSCILKAVTLAQEDEMRVSSHISCTGL